MTNLTHFQEVLLGNRDHIGRNDIALLGNTLYRRCFYDHDKKNNRIRGWLPILKLEEGQWVGYNYSGKDFASYLLNNQWQRSHYWSELKYVQIGRGIGCKGTKRLWSWQCSFKRFMTKMINPTMDMLLPEDTVFDLVG